MHAHFIQPGQEDTLRPPYPPVQQHPEASFSDRPQLVAPVAIISRLSLAGSPATSSNYNIYKYSQGAVELFHAVSYGELPAGGPLSNAVNVSFAVRE